MDKRELKRQYLSTPRPMGVYQIVNKVNGKRLLGAALDLPGLLNSQQFQLRLGSHPCRELQEDWRRYGEGQFAFEELDRLKPEEGKTRDDYRRDAEALLEMWLEKLQPYDDRGYNRRPVRRDR